MIAHAYERRLSVGQWQQVVEISAVMGGPGEMLGEKAGLVALDQVLEARQMSLIEGVIGTDRQPNPVQGKRIAVANESKVVMRRTAGAHVVLSVDLKKSKLWHAFKYLAVVLRLEADANTGRNQRRDTIRRNGCGHGLLPQLPAHCLADGEVKVSSRIDRQSRKQTIILLRPEQSTSLESPCSRRSEIALALLRSFARQIDQAGLLAPPTILAQVPAGTIRNADASAFLVDEPAHEAVAVLQSFWPALATA